jgi:hypothetical protein
MRLNTAQFPNTKPTLELLVQTTGAADTEVVVAAGRIICGCIVGRIGHTVSIDVNLQNAHFVVSATFPVTSKNFFQIEMGDCFRFKI